MVELEGLGEEFAELFVGAAFERRRMYFNLQCVAHPTCHGVARRIGNGLDREAATRGHATKNGSGQRLGQGGDDVLDRLATERQSHQFWLKPAGAQLFTAFVASDKIVVREDDERT